MSATLLGSALAPYLVVQHPYALLALNPWPRHQILVAPRATFLPFVAVVGVRGLLSCWIAYELGKYYGPRGTAAIEGEAPNVGRFMRKIERLFGRFSLPLLFFIPGWMTCALAGTSGLSRRNALTLSTLGLMAWACVNHRLGEWLEPWTAPVVAFLREHMLSATVVCAALVVLYQLRSRRKPSVTLDQAEAAPAEPRALD